MNILYDERLDGPLPQVDKDGLLAELRLRLPDLELLHAAEDLRPYECDGLSAYRCTPLLVALPERIEQVQGLLALCHRLKVPVVARGAGTGLSGGALPLENGVLLVMARFRRILEIDPLGRFARVQPGVRNLAISQAAAPHGLYYAPDPSSQIACSIGGNVAENAGGVHCLKYGLTVHNLLQVDIVTLEGERLSLGSSALDSAGFDLLALFTGSEGLLGVVVEVTVRLLPRPPVAKVLLASFDDVIASGSASCSRRLAPPRCDRPKTRPSASASGPGARMRFRRSGGFPPITTAWTAASRAASCRGCCMASPSFRANTACGWPTYSTPATATCTR